MVLLFIATFLFFLAGGGEFLLFGGPKFHTSCTADNRPEEVLDAKTGEKHNRANWSAACTIRRDAELIYTKKLVLSYPATRQDAYDAMDEFQDKTAPEFLKEWAKNQKQEKPQ